MRHFKVIFKLNDFHIIFRGFIHTRVYGRLREASGGWLTSLAYTPHPPNPAARYARTLPEDFFCENFSLVLKNQICGKNRFRGKFWSNFFFSKCFRIFFFVKSKKFFGLTSSLGSVHYAYKVSSKSVEGFRRNWYRTHGQTTFFIIRIF